MSEHTPGPWAVNPALAQVDAFVLSPSQAPIPVCQMLWPTDERSEAETEANARLVAAAPDILAALKEARKGCQLLDDLCACGADDDYVRDLLSTIDSALAKAGVQ